MKTVKKTKSARNIKRNWIKIENCQEKFEHLQGK